MNDFPTYGPPQRPEGEWKPLKSDPIAHHARKVEAIEALRSKWADLAESSQNDEERREAADMVFQLGEARDKLRAGTPAQEQSQGAPGPMSKMDAMSEGVDAATGGTTWQALGGAVGSLLAGEPESVKGEKAIEGEKKRGRFTTVKDYKAAGGKRTTELTSIGDEMGPALQGFGEEFEAKAGQARKAAADHPVMFAAGSALPMLAIPGGPTAGALGATNVALAMGQDDPQSLLISGGLGALGGALAKGAGAIGSGPAATAGSRAAGIGASGLGAAAVERAGAAAAGQDVLGRDLPDSEKYGGFLPKSTALAFGLGAGARTLAEGAGAASRAIRDPSKRLGQNIEAYETAIGEDVPVLGRLSKKVNPDELPATANKAAEDFIGRQDKRYTQGYKKFLKFEERLRGEYGGTEVDPKIVAKLRARVEKETGPKMLDDGTPTPGAQQNPLAKVRESFGKQSTEALAETEGGTALGYAQGESERIWTVSDLIKLRRELDDLGKVGASTGDKNSAVYARLARDVRKAIAETPTPFAKLYRQQAGQLSKMEELNDAVVLRDNAKLRGTQSERERAAGRIGSYGADDLRAEARGKALDKAAEMDPELRPALDKIRGQRAAGELELFGGGAPAFNAISSKEGPTGSIRANIAKMAAPLAARTDSLIRKGQRRLEPAQSLFLGVGQEAKNRKPKEKKKK